MSLKTTFAVYPKEPTEGGGHIGIFGKVGEGRVRLHVGWVFFYQRHLEVGDQVDSTFQLNLQISALGS